MSKMKAILKNPVLLATQGFLAGALLMWSTPQLLDLTPGAPPAAEASLVPPVS